MLEMNRSKMIFMPFVLGLTLLASGCGDKPIESDRPETAKVTGTVKYKGNPVEGATVTFMPATSKEMSSVGKGNAAYGITDKDGAYSLKTFNPDDGAVPGSYIVTVTKYPQASLEPVPDVDSADYNPDESAAPAKPPKNELPARYETVRTSDLTAEVKSGTDNNFDLELKD